MINRILIRIKVIQMLYSYLLTRSDFKIETAPDTASRDKRYAYAVYFDFLLFILELSGYNVTPNRQSPLHSIGPGNLLAGTKLAKSLASNDEIKAIIAKGNNNVELYESIALRVYNSIVTSSVFRDYKKIKSPEIKDEISFWCVIIKTILAKEQLLIDAARSNEIFTIKGFELGLNMLVETLANYCDMRTSFVNAQKSLEASFDKSHELYYSLLTLMVDLTKYQYQRIDAAKTKYLPTDEDLNPNTRFIDNELISSIERNPDYIAYQSQHHLTWSNDPILLKSLIDKIISSPMYDEYMSAPVNDYASDCKFWRNVLKNIIFTSDEFCEALETQSIYWNDDLQVIGTFVIKTIKHFAASEGNNVSLLPQFKDDEDARFGNKLFVDIVNNYDQYRGYIDKFIDSKEWDSERLAFMDTIIMSAAISELLIFPEIPIPVTLNEYIEIANSYSTAKSGQFINGIMFSIINYLKAEGLLNK